MTDLFCVSGTSPTEVRQNDFPLNVLSLAWFDARRLVLLPAIRNDGYSRFDRFNISEVPTRLCTSFESEGGMSAKIGRNEPCPCGSGKKYKRCCLVKEERERREQAAIDARWNTNIWFPTADDLQLPDVPENLRREVRRVLDCALPLLFERGVGIRSQRCWLIAQALTATANGELGYVEGVWTRSPENKWYGPDDTVGFAAHAWNAFRGHTIDLIAEFYNWNSFGEDRPWLHEPLEEYSLAELRGLDCFDETIDAYSDYGDISSCVLVPHDSLPDHFFSEVWAMGIWYCA